MLPRPHPRAPLSLDTTRASGCGLSVSPCSAACPGLAFIPAFIFLGSPRLEVSRVSKRKMFALFQQLCAKSNCKELQKLSVYSDAKEAAAAYQESKRCFFSTLEELGYGSWIRKPQEEENFSFPDAS